MYTYGFPFSGIVCLCLNVRVSVLYCKLLPYTSFSILPWSGQQPYFFLPLFPTPFNVCFSKVHPCGDQWRDILISVAVFHVWVIALLYIHQIPLWVQLLISHFLDLCLSYRKWQYSEGWGVVSFLWWFLVTEAQGWALQAKASSPEIFRSGLWWLSVLTVAKSTLEMCSGFHHLCALLYFLLFTGSQDGFLSDAVWFLLVILIGILLW